MLNRLADLIRLRTSVDSVVQPARPATPLGSRDFEPGAIVRAQVIAALPRGLFEVRIEDRSFVLRLPYKAEPDDQLQLIVTSGEPRLKFALSERENSNATPTRLSETAHFVTSLLGRNDNLPLAAGARVRQPLFSGLEVNSRDIAVSLKQALAHSGIFYEAHQAEWVAGNRPLAELLKEPQAQLNPLPENNERRANEVLPPRSDPPVHHEALAIVKQQLDTLDTRHLAWNGEVWPGQVMDWEVSDQPQRGKRAAEEPHWQTTLRMDLPRLGGLSAGLGVTQRGVTIALRAKNAETAAAMSGHVEALRRALHAAGVTPLDIVVRKHDEA